MGEGAFFSSLTPKTSITFLFFGCTNSFFFSDTQNLYYFALFWVYRQFFLLSHPKPPLFCSILGVLSNFLYLYTQCMPLLDKILPIKDFYESLYIKFFSEKCKNQRSPEFRQDSFFLFIFQFIQTHIRKWKLEFKLLCEICIQICDCNSLLLHGITVTNRYTSIGL